MSQHSDDGSRSAHFTQVVYGDWLDDSHRSKPRKSNRLDTSWFADVDCAVIQGRASATKYNMMAATFPAQKTIIRPARAAQRRTQHACVSTRRGDNGCVTQRDRFTRPEDHDAIAGLPHTVPASGKNWVLFMTAWAVRVERA